MKISRQIFSLILLLATSTACIANTTDYIVTSNINAASNKSHSSIEAPTKTTEQLVNEFLRETAASLEAKGFRTDYTTGKIDPYFAKRICKSTPSLTFNKDPREQNNLTLLISCPDSKTWKFYLSVKLNIYGTALAAAHNILRDQVISKNDLVEKEIIINRYASNHYEHVKDVIGMVARRSIRADSSIQPNYLKPPKLIKRGDDVVIIASNNAISVKMMGTALADGLLGQQIPVKNAQSKRVIKARVQEAGLVSITL